MSTDSRHTRPALALRTHDLSFRWPGSDTRLCFPDLTLPQGEHLFLRGRSGCGKSTLLGLIAGLQAPSQGTLTVLGTDMSRLSARQRDRFRADHLGVVFQHFNLVPYLSALDNVLLPCRLSPVRHERATPEPTGAAHTLLRRLDIPEDHWQRRVVQLSVGQQQRIAAARALIGTPELILADEPTSALDTDNRDRFLDLLLDLAAERGSSVVFVSHDSSLQSHFQHHSELIGGHL